MDNITHTLAGIALARTGLGRTTRFGSAALILGSNLPDMDLVALLGGRLAFIDAHRGISHSIVVASLLAVLFGAGLRALARFRPRGGAGGESAGSEEARTGALIGLALLAVLVHLGFDWLNDYGVRLLLPFTDRWFYGDIIFIVDPWFWLLLGGGAHLSVRKGSRLEPWRWAGWGLLTIPVLMDFSPPMPARALWLLGLGILAVLRFRTRTPSAWWPRWAFVALGFYVLAAAGLHARALENAASATRARESRPVSRLAVIPRPADPLHWNLIYETPEDVVSATVPVRQSPVSPSEHRYEKHLDDARTQRALATPAGQVARRFCRYLFADIEEEPGGAADVSFRDARFAIRGRREFSVFVVRVEP